MTPPNPPTPRQPYRPGQSISAAAVARILDELRRTAATAGAPASTLYLPANTAGTTNSAIPPDLMRDPHWTAWQLALQDAGVGIGSRAPRFPTGVAAFRVDDHGIAIVPAFPLSADRLPAGMLVNEINDAPLRALLNADYLVGAALVRLGRYAIAVYQGRQLLVSKTDTRYVKSKHSAGGTSQQRFRRVRENQIHRLYAKASQVLTQQWQPYASRLDYVALGGEAATINGFVKECPLLTRLAPITLPGRLDIREPNRAALDTVGEMLYRCRVYPLRWSGSVSY